MALPTIGSSGGGYTGGGGAGGGSVPVGALSAPLSFGSAGSGLISGGLAGLGANYAQSYDQAVAANQQLYGNIIGGYQQAFGQQNAAQNNLAGEYNTLQSNVLGGIQGIETSQQQAIQAAYAQQSGAATQGLINSGLGNSTVNSSVQTGLLQSEQQAQTALQNQFAQTQAGYQSQLGLAGLNYQGQAINADTALSNAQLQFENSVSIPYPNAQLYSQLAQQYGQTAAQNSLLNLYKRGAGPMSLTGSSGTTYGKGSGYPGLSPSPGGGAATGGGMGGGGSGYGFTNTPSSSGYTLADNAASGIGSGVANALAGFGGAGGTYGDPSSNSPFGTLGNFTASGQQTGGTIMDEYGNLIDAQSGELVPTGSALQGQSYGDNTYADGSAADYSMGG